MLSQETNPGVEFEYSVPSGYLTETPSDGEGYVWSPGPWSDCATECGGEMKNRQILCVLGGTKEVVEDNLCDQAEKPPETEPCNTEPCEVLIFF